tara:strand:+ start:1715 stop:2293 length:579 start_codon:yes stop_codon:yes gene_type:complete
MRVLQKGRTAIFLSFLTIFLSCSSESINQDLELNKATVSVNLIGAQAEFDLVNIEVLDVQVKVIDDESVPNCWLSLNVNSKGIYNLLDLIDDSEANLVNSLKIPAGEIYEVKLVLGDNNTIVIDGKTLPLVMNSEHAKGLVVRTEKDLKSNTDYSFSINFDVKKSILKTNIKDRIILSPVLSVSLQTLSNGI